MEEETKETGNKGDEGGMEAGYKGRGRKGRMETGDRGGMEEGHRKMEERKKGGLEEGGKEEGQWRGERSDSAFWEVSLSGWGIVH